MTIFPTLHFVGILPRYKDVIAKVVIDKTSKKNVDSSSGHCCWYTQSQVFKIFSFGGIDRADKIYF